MRILFEPVVQASRDITLVILVPNDIREEYIYDTLLPEWIARNSTHFSFYVPNVITSENQLKDVLEPEEYVELSRLFVKGV